MTVPTPGRRRFLQASLAAAATIPFGRTAGAVESTAPRPNILWLTAEDIGPHLGCYGDTYADSPHIDALAARGLRYDRAWSNAPVCAPARTAIITGMHPTSLGAEHMRSMVRIPESMRLFPQLLRDHGYYCTNNRKEDYNIQPHGEIWDESSGAAHWKNRAEGQPFFAVFNFTESHESRIRTRPHELQRDPAGAPVPPYHPDTPEVRHDWAQYYDTIEEMDARVGQALAELDEAGLSEDTIVFFYGDHGSGMPRHKRWPYNSGLHVPYIVHVPEKFRHLAPSDYEPGGATGRLTDFVDLAPTVLSLAGLQAPMWMHGRAIMGAHEAEPNTHLFGYRGRMDERIDMVRSVTDGRFVYIRNFMPHLIQGQHLEYMWQTPTTQVWQRMYRAGELEPPQTHFWEPKAPEELYDLENDPHEVNNLADSAAHGDIRAVLAAILHGHMGATRDTGLLPEAELHRRAGADTIREMALDRERYPIVTLDAAARIAASRDEAAIPRLVEWLGHDDPGVRYWAVIGVLTRGAAAFEPMADALRDALDDANPSVRVAAASAVGKYGGEADRQRAVDTLAELVSPEDNSVHVAVAALNAVEMLGDEAAALRPLIAALPLEDPREPERLNRYVGRLVTYITSAEPDWP